MLYCISYDLCQPDRDYEELYQGIKSFGQWWHQTGSVWFVVSSKTPVEIRDYLEQFIDSNDKLFVIALKKKWAGIGFSNKEYEWLKSLPNETWNQ